MSEETTRGAQDSPTILLATTVIVASFMLSSLSHLVLVVIIIFLNNYSRRKSTNTELLTYCDNVFTILRTKVTHSHNMLTEGGENRKWICSRLSVQAKA